MAWGSTPENLIVTVRDRGNVSRSNEMEWSSTLATIIDTIDDNTFDVSYSDSLTYSQVGCPRGCTPSCISSLPRNMGCPPNNATALSVLTRVRVLRLLNMMATVCPARGPGVNCVRPGSRLFVLTECFNSAERERTDFNSGTERSAIDKRCRV